MKMLDGSFMMIIIAFNITLMELGWHQADWIGGTLTTKADCGSRLPHWNQHQSQQQTTVVFFIIFNLLKTRVRYLRNQKCIHRRSSQWMTQKKCVERELRDFQGRFDAESPNAAEAARWWDEFKAHLIVKMLQSNTTARRKLTNTYRQIIRRLEKQRLRALARARHEADDRAGAEAHDTLKRVDTALAECRRERSRQRQRRLFRDHTWTPAKTTKNLFRRISCIFSDNLVPSLRPPEGCPVRGIHEKSETFADAWAPILQGAIPSSEVISQVADWMPTQPGDSDTDVLADNNFITEEAVAAALKECKADKSCGPDRLGNDWYLDFAEMLIPVQTRLYKLWYETGEFPACRGEYFLSKENRRQLKPSQLSSVGPSKY
ncbi:hypothetical protein PF005_g8928 [Phytophthora fragariae]|uniref:Reverse transcriptase domain-containing protein n=1 Tax=Phytophthora fragariae TaxID=53985 RepID=A0A6A3ZUT2_9STRA|nr:hypothetical protein PF003_g9099 [Phytophthora fragariae]KAE8941176.1 hypothetical protein PF009_g9040 [Phytophthora fragariae]KAE9145867.1 hypothetical protein PF006_g9318 [Phytophthora fragariae]KAE9216751.1 hypothetical protein PF005_g8928 [Phytophthora fragariae]KAE9242294.1 hypothetical protein PF002_g8822 [Phytophthora fragariae]